MTPAALLADGMSAVAFDLFGTLVRWSDETVPSAAHVLFHYRPELDRRQAAAVIALVEGRDGEAQFEAPPDAAEYRAWQDRSWGDAARAAGVALDEDLLRLMRLAVRVRKLELFPDTLPALRLLHEHGVPWALCSNASPDVAAKFAGLLPAQFRPTASILSCEVGARKPHPRMYRALRDAVGTSPAETLFIGDRADCDYLGPMRAGFPAVLVERPAAGRPVDAVATPPAAPPQHRWDSLGPLAGLLPDRGARAITVERTHDD
jgi:HAD superfamily hydrolase (TIGR01493 family)